jgi:uncharacterized protein (DUF58 family)
MSARIPGRLLVREHEDPRVRDVAILLETFVPKPGDARRRGRLERAIAFSATLADTLLGAGYHVRFRAFGPEPVALELDPRRRELDDLLRELALLRPTRTHSLSELLAAEESPKDEVLFLLRIGDEPLPERDELPHAVLLGAADMRSMMDELPLASEGAEGEAE